MFDTPGWHQLLGDPASGKTTLATISTWKYESSLFITTHAEYSPGLWEVIRAPENVVVVASVRVAFEAMEEAQAWAEFIVLDSLATLQPEHPLARQVARAIKRHWFKPKIPILVVNQLRHPRPMGGQVWHSNCQTYVLEKHREKPHLYSRLKGTDLWLVWDKGGPRLRKLDEADKNWIGG